MLLTAKHIQKPAMNARLITYLIAFGFLIIIPNSTRASLTAEERLIIATTLILEAEGEGKAGMQAVLNVIYNRANHRIAKMVEVVTNPGIFSSLNSATYSPSPDYGPLIQRALSSPQFGTAYTLVNTLERSHLFDITYGSDYFHSIQIENPEWTNSMRHVRKIGAHRFYRSNTYKRPFTKL